MTLVQSGYRFNIQPTTIKGSDDCSSVERIQSFFNSWELLPPFFNIKAPAY